VCRALEPFASHFFTTRAWRLGSATAEEQEDAWADVAEAAGVRPDRLVRLRQVHGAAVVVVRGPRPPVALPTADVVVTADTQSALAIQTADCVPLLIADRRTGAVAAAHAGWRGIAARVPHAATAALRREFGSQPDDLIAVIGPSIGTCCYEVGLDVRAAFVDAAFDADQISQWFTEAPRPTARNPSMPGLPPTRRSEHWYFDGPGAVRDQLLACGVPADRVYAADLCTASHPELCSYRRDGLRAGRLAAMIRPRGAR
jgi:hypothetical protein